MILTKQNVFGVFPLTLIDSMFKLIPLKMFKGMISVILDNM